MANHVEVKKWFHEGDPDSISKIQYRMMSPKHRELYNLHRQKQQLAENLKEVESKIVTLSEPILAEISTNPESTMNNWSWWETLEAPHPKWAIEFEAAMGKAKTDEVRSKYKKTKSIFLRIKYIHPRPPESQ